MSDGPAAPILEVRDLSAGYANNRILNGMSFVVEKGEIALLVGHNGAGKSTILKAISGLLPWCEGEILVDGKAIGRPNVRRNALNGLSIVLQHQGYFPNFSVLDNLRLGGFLLQSRSLIKRRLAHVFEIFPQLMERRQSQARTLSGGEQRMLSMGVALMLEPRILLVDEPSAGLSPRLVGDVMHHLQELQQKWDTTILLVEQNVTAGLTVADKVLVVRLGSITQVYEAERLRSGEEKLQLL